MNDKPGGIFDLLWILIPVIWAIIANLKGEKQTRQKNEKKQYYPEIKPRAQEPVRVKPVLKDKEIQPAVITIAALNQRYALSPLREAALPLETPARAVQEETRQDTSYDAQHLTIEQLTKIHDERPVEHASIVIDKDEILKAVILSEIIGPPRGI